MIDRSSGDVLVIHDDKEDYVEFLVEAGASPANAESLSDQEQQQLKAILQSLKDAPFNQGAAGQVKVRIRNIHFPLRKTIFTTVVIGASFAAAGILLATTPMTGPAGAAAAAGAVSTALVAAQQVSDLVTKLKPDQIIVYDTLLEVAKRRQAKNEAPLGGTITEIEEVLIERNQRAALPSLRNVLGSLANDKVITKLEGNEVRYSATR